MLLFLNSLGTGEVIIVLMVILMFFGSKNIPSIARTMGKGIRQMKDASQEIQNEITKSTTSMKNDLNIQREIERTVNDMDKPKPKSKTIETAQTAPVVEPPSIPKTESDKNLEA
jgi:sec-independent protein translocase protein TatA